MNRRNALGTLTAAALGSTGAAAVAAEDKGHGHEHFDACARACADCMRECESCAHHYAHMVAGGKKEHMRTLGTWPGWSALEPVPGFQWFTFVE